MAEPITPKGIQRNATKLEVEDGRAEDLINLRFKDGSWRTAGDGKRVFAMEDLQGDHIYTQLYIHSCSPYHHLLGVENGALYWFANIGNDGETFEEVERQEICNVVGDLWISQTGHLITIIDGADDFEYAVFKTGDNLYKVLDVDVNGKQNSRKLYPFGNVHINWYTPDAKFNTTDYKNNGYTEDIDIGSVYFGNNIHFPVGKTSEAINKLHENNKFVNPMFIVVAIRMYDNSFIYACNPIFIYPNEYTIHNPVVDVYCPNTLTDEEHVMSWLESTNPNDNSPVYQPLIDKYVKEKFTTGKTGVLNNPFSIKTSYNPLDHEVAGCPPGKKIWYMNNLQTSAKPHNVFPSEYAIERLVDSDVPGGYPYTISPKITGYDIAVSIDDFDIIKRNSDVFSAVSIFVTKEVNVFEKKEDDDTEYKTIARPFNCQWEHVDVSSSGNDVSSFIVKRITSYHIQRRSKDDIIYDLVNTPFYLLAEYTIKELSRLENNPIIDLNTPEHKGIVTTINNGEGTRLDYESMRRDSYIPKTSYMYNNRLHIANYTTLFFHGYPFEQFIMNNHSVKFASGSLFLNSLRNLEGHSDELNATYDGKIIIPTQSMVDNKIPVVIINTEYEDTSGHVKVSRYITPDNTDGIYVENISPYLCFPDMRAENMDIYIFYNMIGDDIYIFNHLHFELKNSSYFDIAYHFDELYRTTGTFGTLQLTKLDIENLIAEENSTEFNQNGIKVSKTENPLVFPVENAYKISSGTIIALCSNAIAVGTGQTGAAPLYVFCTDGIYALYVDSSGEMAYTNARIIARDVCNNAKSVTPIDTGVVFTTDRGLMEIAGDVVNEIGQPAEGDVVDYTEPDWAKPRNVGKNMLTKVANLPLNLVDGVDFLRYLTGAIVNYNHNERELMISNPEYPYTYVLDRYSNWSRRDYSADEYVNNYPTSYRVKDGVFYKVDAEQDGLEGKSEAPNDFLYLSNVIKLGSVDFKKAYRFVVRGKFDTNEMRNTSFYSPTSSVVLYDKTQEENIIKTLVNDKPYTIRPKYDDAYRYIYRLTIYDNNNQEIFSGETVNGVIEFTVSNWGNVSFISFGKVDSSYPTHEHVISIENTHVLGCYVFGSYDGRQFAMLGANEKKGTFTDIGCKIERTDVKYFRVGLAGHLSGDSRIDFMEVEGEQSNLTTKLR